MDTFEHRERSFESAFAQDEELTFRIRIAALRKLGHWATQTLEVPATNPESLVARALEGTDDETLLADLALALQQTGVSAHRVRSRWAGFIQEATRELRG